MLEEQQSNSNVGATLPTTSIPQTGSRLNQIGSQSYKIITQYGDMLVIKQGIQLQPQQTGGGQPNDSQQSHQQRPIIMTFHDLGLNSELQFATFCECEEVKLMLKTFTMVHVNFIGQEFPSQQHQQQISQQQFQTTTTTPITVTSNTLPDNFKYPNMEQMAESIVDICTQLRIRSFIAIAVGAGAHIVGHLALMRPDLVDGLFLINPVITSCSITEWLYFKMSAIASNHSIGSWNSAIGGGKDWSISSSPTSVLSSSPSSNNSSSIDQHNVNKNQTSTTTTTTTTITTTTTTATTDTTTAHDTNHHKHSHGIGFKRLLNAAHLHFPHHHHHNQKLQQHDSKSNNETLSSTDLKQSSPKNEQITAEQRECSRDTETGSENDDSKSITARLESNMAISTTPIKNTQHQTGSRFRQLIFSRNIRNTHHSDYLSQTSSNSASNASTSGDTGHSKHKQSSSKVKSSDSDDSIDSQRGGSGNKRPPCEYLMYHHFGPISFQTYRRSSDTPLLTMFDNRDSPSRIQQRPQSGKSAANSEQGSPATLERSRSKRAITDHQASSSSSIANSNLIQESKSGRCRSGSVCIDSLYLASFENDRQRSSYIQSVYKYYFSQINSHNLWLFAQSFAKRRSLNLRKDCGAAAHAAAAAATLGTSICSAFVGMAPGPSFGNTSSSSAHHPHATSSSRSDANKPVSDISSGSTTKQQQQQQQETKANDTKVDSSSPKHDNSSLSKQNKTLSNKKTSAAAITRDSSKTTGTSQRHAISGAKSKQNCQQPKALVAGTKVKRTFTCQTLIMCSSVQIHRERAFKLMSLLNPLQATWIQTDHMLVLEEKPEKVCQALRLFLQGIGYSMSTYERRLRLSSTTGSAGSADSNSSAPCLGEKQH